MGSDAMLAGWAASMEPMEVESAWSRQLAHFGVIASITALVGYLTWRIGFTMPADGWNRVAAWLLIAFEAFPLFGLITRMITLWNIDWKAPGPVLDVRPGLRAAVLIPTYNEPIEVIAPTIAAACELQPAHETWVLDDGDRAWVAEMCATLGARYVRRDEHDHAKAGNMNHALDLMAAESEAGADPIDIVAVLDCDHVPMPTFLSATLGWFDDPKIALVQGPQNYYNSAAFDDDGDTGEQGVFFHVLLAARNRDGAGPFWCGSTSLIRVSALREVGGISTATIVEDMHTTLGLIRRGWKTAYHHQILAVGLAPATPEQYLLQRRRWGMGSMQVLTKERLWAAKRWLSWRNYYEYLSGTVWWLEGVGTALAFFIPALVLLSGARVSTADPLLFTGIFVAMFAIRLWGAKRLFRMHIHWPTAFALRILRVPVGLSCIWWLLTRRSLEFQVTPKAGAMERLRGRTPRVLWALGVFLGAVFVYVGAGLTGLAPWHTTPTTSVASGAWLALAGVVLLLGLRRIRAEAYATSRRNAHRFAIRAMIHLGDVPGELLDLSMGGAAVRFPAGALTGVDKTQLRLPGADPIPMWVIRTKAGANGSEIASLRVGSHDWLAYRELALWLFHTPPGAIEGLPLNVPAVAVRQGASQMRNAALARQYAVGNADVERGAVPTLERFVGVALVGLALLGAALMGLAAVLTLQNSVPVDGTSTKTIFGFWRLLYSTSAPPIGIVVAAAGFALLLAAVVALVERRVATLARTNDDRERMPLAPKLVMADTRGVYAGPVTVSVLIPAHNEAACIADTIASLRSQSHQPERIVVVADNCTDDTVPIARGLGVDVFETVGNTKKKAGALNQALPAVLADLGDNDMVMVMDADTTLDQGFLATAVRRLSDDRALMAVGGLFYGEEGAGLIGQFQRNEYFRYARKIRRRRGRVFVLTGTASIFRPRALRTVAAERGRSIPGVPGDFYDTLVLTEDNELTLAIKSLGGLMISPGRCTVVTEVMQTWRALWAQRLRWQRGAVENLGSYGLRPSVMRYWAQQLGIGYGVVAIAAYVLLVLLMMLAMNHWVWFPFWIVVGLIFVVERVVTVWRGGWRARLLAATLFPELVYAMFLNLVYVKGILDIAGRRQAGWKHIVQNVAAEPSARR